MFLTRLSIMDGRLLDTHPGFSTSTLAETLRAQTHRPRAHDRRRADFYLTDAEESVRTPQMLEGFKPDTRAGSDQQDSI